MHLGSKKQADPDAVPLQGAVLCMNCECVTSSLSDACVVCGSRSLFSLAKLLGGAQLSSMANRPARSSDIALLDVELMIELKQFEPKGLSDLVESITNLILPTLVRGEGRFHINVEPAEQRDSDKVKAA
jgi:hypothetical protein